MKKLLLLLLASAITLPAAGTVGISAAAIGQGGTNWLVLLRWTGDAANGTVPVRSFTLTNWQIAGYLPTVVEFSPGSPAPTNGYSVKIADPSGVDILAGAAATLSSTVPAAFAASATAPPLDTFTVTITGQSVAGGQGAIYLFLSKPNTTTAAKATSGSGGTVTQAVIAGTANKVAVSGTCTIVSIGTCTITLPDGTVLV
jgi:hypothetical protein